MAPTRPASTARAPCAEVKATSTITVHPTDAGADAASLTHALAKARPGDVVLVGAGTYSPTHTRESLPLRVPPGVSLEGMDQDSCVVDGAGWFEPSFDPIRVETSVLLLEDGASVSGLMVMNGGAHGVGVPPGVTAEIRDCAITGHGQHGIFLSGVAEAFVTRCRFEGNGTKRFEPRVPRSAKARQGHQIFAEARAAQRNRLVATDNVMRGCFADGITVACLVTDPGVTFSATVIGNTIEDSERGGLLFAASFGSARNRCRVVAAGNLLRGNRQIGVGVLGATPLAGPVPRENTLVALIMGNTISESEIGVLVRGSQGEAAGNVCRVTADRNRIAGYGAHAIRLVAAIGVDGVTTAGNLIEATLSRNVLSGSAPPVVVQAAAGGGDLHGNAITVRFVANETVTPIETSLVVADGPDGNHVRVTDGSQRSTRVDSAL